MNKGDAGGVVLIFGGVVLLLAAVNGSLANVWHAIWVPDSAGTPTNPNGAVAQPGQAPSPTNPVGTPSGPAGPVGPASAVNNAYAASVATAPLLINAFGV